MSPTPARTTEAWIAARFVREFIVKREMLIPPPATPEDEIRGFYAALGKAITQWQSVEEGLTVIFSAAIGGEAAGAAANAAFQAALNFNTKLAMVDSALATIAFLSAFHRMPGEASPMYADWTPLKNRASRRADRRNEMAHFAMHLDETRKPGYRCYLAPNVINVNAMIRYAGKPPKRYTCNVIAQGNSFDKLAFDLQMFYISWLSER